MIDDFIDELEQQLRAASHRRVRLAAARIPRPRVVSVTVGLRAVPIALAICVVIAIAVVALTEVKHSPRSSPTSPAVAGRQQLIEILGVLRRPQSKGDRSYSKNVTRSPPMLALGSGAPDISLIRYATTTPWGERLFFVPIKPPTAGEIARSVNQLPRRDRGQARRGLILQAKRGETLSVFSARGGGGSATAADIKAGFSLQTEGAGRSFAGGSTRTRLILVVPDGVAKVVFMLGRQSAGVGYGSPVYQHPLKVAVPVHDNVAAVQVDRQFQGGRPPMIWYAADGQVIKRIGNFAKANRVIVPPRPGPPTALSRAAERDPSTPNRVWVTPRIGGPHTNFKVHFRVLINDADYRYHLSGTTCPAITVNGGDGGGSNDRRGQIWSDFVDAVAGQTWCPGTYHLSATVMDLGRNGNLKHPARPFGSATFTVRH